MSGSQIIKSATHPGGCWLSRIERRAQNDFDEKLRPFVWALRKSEIRQPQRNEPNEHSTVIDTRYPARLMGARVRIKESTESIVDDAPRS